MKIAVIKTGGKQYKVKEGDVIAIEKLPNAEGEKVIFDEVLFVGDDKEIKIGAPMLSEVKVSGEILKQFRDDKVVTIKHHSKKRYLKKIGHKQQKTQVKILKIG